MMTSYIAGFFFVVLGTSALLMAWVGFPYAWGTGKVALICYVISILAFLHALIQACIAKPKTEDLENDS